MNPFRREEAFRILAIAVMMASLVRAALELVGRVITGFDPAFVVALSFLVCMEGIATDRLARQIPEANLRLRLHLSEWVIILLLLRLTLSLSQGSAALAHAVTQWLARPQSLFDSGFVASAILLFGIWWLGLTMSRSLESLGPEAEEAPPQDSAAYYAWLTRPRTDVRGEGWSRLVQLFLVGGIVLLICSGMARLDIGAALSLSNPAIGGIVGNALLYFGLGFVILAQGNYAMLRAGWKRNQVEVSNKLTARWTAWGVGFVAGVAILALLLPVRPSLALFGAVFDALWVLFQGLVSIVLAVFAVLSYLFGLLISLLGMRVAEGGGDAPDLRLTPSQPPAPEQPVAWWEAVQGLVLWAVIGAVVIYAVIRFLRDHRDLWRQLSARGPLGWIAGVLAALRRWLGRTGGQVRERLRALRLQPARRAGAGGAQRRIAWPRPRTPREQVRLLYLVALQHAAHEGYERRAQDTPYEYARRLEPAAAESKDDLDALTLAFVEARYGRREFAPDEIGPLRDALRRLRRWLSSLASERGERR